MKYNLTRIASRCILAFLTSVSVFGQGAEPPPAHKEPYFYATSFKPSVNSTHVDYLTIYAYLAFRGLRPSNPPSKILFGYSVPSSESAIQPETPLTILLDGEGLYLGEPVIETCEDRGFIESTKKCHTYALSTDSFSKIAHAKKVEVRLGTLRFDIAEKVLEGYRDLLEGTPPVGRRRR